MPKSTFEAESGKKRTKNVQIEKSKIKKKKIEK